MNLSSPSDHQPLASYVTDESEDDSSSIDMDTDNCSLRVRFAGSDQVLEVPSRDSFTEDEIRSTWYKKGDYQEMRNQAQETINIYKAGNLMLGDSEHSMRGLESRTYEGFSIVRENRRVASFAVIDEQDRQDEMGISDSDLIAEAYQSCTVTSQYLALVQGLLDQQEAQDEAQCQQAVPSQESSSSKPVATSQEVSVDQNALLCLISPDEMQDMAVESMSFAKDTDEVALNSMEWTAEAA